MEEPNTECEGHHMLEIGFYVFLFGLAMGVLFEYHYSCFITGLGAAFFTYGIGLLDSAEKFQTPEALKNSACKTCQKSLDDANKRKDVGSEVKGENEVGRRRPSIVKHAMVTPEILAERNKIFADLGLER